MSKKYLSMLLALCLLFSLASCASSGNSKTETEHPFIECPLPGIEWGMTKAEVYEKLSIPEDSYLHIPFSGEQTNCGAVVPKDLAWDDPQIAGMDLAYYAGDTTNYRGINMVFSEPINGEQYLVSIIVSLRAKDDAAYNAAMTAAYGDPADPWGKGEKAFWISDNEGNALDEATLTAYEEVGLYILPYYEEELQTWHTLPIAYLWAFSMDENDVVDGMRNYPTEFNAYTYVMMKLHEESGS